MDNFKAIQSLNLLIRHSSVLAGVRNKNKLVMQLELERIAMQFVVKPMIFA